MVPSCTSFPRRVNPLTLVDDSHQLEFSRRQRLWAGCWLGMGKFPPPPLPYSHRDQGWLWMQPLQSWLQCP